MSRPKPGNLSTTFRIKALCCAATAIALIVMPEDFLHLLAVIAHTLYESVAFAVEELLTHVFKLSKFHAQMTVFYSSCAILIFAAYRGFKRLLVWLKNLKSQAMDCYLEIRQHLLAAWSRLPARQKLKIILLQFAWIAGSFGFLLA